MTSDNQILTGTQDPVKDDDLSPLNIESVEQEDGSIEIEFLDDEIEDYYNIDEDALIDETGHYENLALYLEDSELAIIAGEVLDGLFEDETSRHGHIQELIDGIEQLGLSEDDNASPVDGGCTVTHPLIMENAVKIQAKAESELLPASGPVRTQILGSYGENQTVYEQQAKRIKQHMNWQATEQIKEYYKNTQKVLLQSALFGDGFKKKWFCPVKGRVRDAIVPVDQLVVNSAAESLDDADRITEIQYISEREMLARQYTGLYMEVDIGDPYAIEKPEIGQKIDELLGLDKMSEGYVIIEQHVYLDLPGFEHDGGVPLPYIVTIEEESQQVLAIRKNWKENDPSRFTKREYYTQYPFVPGFGFYNLGYIHLLGNFQKTLTAVMRNLVDAGAFANLQGGFKLKNMRVLDDGENLAPGEFRDVEFFGNDLSKAIYPLNFKEPSVTLLNMLEFIDAKGQKFADSSEQVVADSTNYGPVGTTMALLDASTKFFSAIFKRFHAAQKEELKIIAALNFENLPDDPQGIEFNIPGETVRITRQDYDDRIDVIPVSDPNISSRAHRITMASQKLQSALQAPQIHDLREAFKQYYIAMGDEDYDKLLPSQEEPQPMEPMQDIMAASQGKPIAAFPDQDHDAHIMVKTSFINDPSVVQNPVFQTAIPAIQANIREHTIMRFGNQLDGAQKLGLDVEQAAQQIQEFNTYKAQNPLGQLDPKQMMAQAELMKQQNESKKIELQQRKNQLDNDIDIAELELELRKQNIDLEKFNLQLASEEELKRYEMAIKRVEQNNNLTSRSE